MRKKRLLWPDIVKAIAMVCIICGHTGISYICSVVQIFHVPVFFFISGYFFKTKMQARDSIVTAFYRIILPYLFTIIVIMIGSIMVSLACSIQTRCEIAIWDIIEGWISAAIFARTSNTVWNGITVYSVGAAWFLPAFFITNCLEALIANRKYRDWYAVVIAVLGFAISRFVHLPLHVETAMICIIFMNLGVSVHERGGVDFEKINGRQVWIMAAVVMLCIVRNLYTHSWVDYASSTFKFYFVGDIICSFFAIILLVLFAQKMAQCQGKLVDWIAWYGKNTMIVLCFHAIESALINWKVFFRFGYLLGGSLAMLIKLTCSVMIIWFVLKNRFLCKLFKAQR